MAAEHRAILFGLSALDHRSLCNAICAGRTAALGLLALAALAADAAASSNDQQDLIARELRMQEDQLYAMEDYISQYQQLVCKYRSENAALRRQVAGDYYEGDVDELPRPASERPAKRSSDAGRHSGPRKLRRRSVEASEAHSNSRCPTSHRSKAQLRPKTNTRSPRPRYDESEVGRSRATATSRRLQWPWKNPRRDRIIGSGPIDRNEVWLRGEVVANDTGGGPRLMVDVTPLDTSGNGAPFDGTLSLMLLEHGEDDDHAEPSSMGFQRRTTSERPPNRRPASMRCGFILELPADTPTTIAPKFGSACCRATGRKLLAHAEIDLRQPGDFASQTKRPGRPGYHKPRR